MRAEVSERQARESNIAAAHSDVPRLNRALHFPDELYNSNYVRGLKHPLLVLAHCYPIIRVIYLLQTRTIQCQLYSFDLARNLDRTINN